MKMRYFYIYETLLYCLSIFFISKNILGYRIRHKIYVYLPLLLFIPMILTATDKSIFYLTFPIYILAFLLAFKVLFEKIMIRSIISTYLVIFSINLIFISIINLFVKSNLLNFYLVDFIFNTITTIIYIAISFSNIRYEIKRMVDWTPKMIKRLCMVTLIVGMLLATVLFDSSAFEHFIKWTVFARVSLGLTLITICVIIPVMVTTSISNNHLKFLTIKFTEQMKNQARHYKALAESNYKIRKFKHDFKNLSFALKKYLAEGRCEEAIKILEEYNKNMASSENIRFDTGNGIADALLEDKAMLAESFGGNIVFKGALPIDKIEPTDICIILGNSLDNAIEEIEKITDNREKIISVSSDIGNGYMFLKIENPVNEKVDISGNHITTTKEDKSLHGFGIFSLKEAIKKYNGKLSFASTNDKFTASIDLSLQ